MMRSERRSDTMEGLPHYSLCTLSSMLSLWCQKVLLKQKVSRPSPGGSALTVTLTPFFLSSRPCTCSMHWPLCVMTSSSPPWKRSVRYVPYILNMLSRLWNGTAPAFFTKVLGSPPCTSSGVWGNTRHQHASELWTVLAQKLQQYA